MNGLCLNDFKEVRFMEITEVLSIEDIEEGLNPITYGFNVAFTCHALRRMHDDFDRQCDFEDVMDLLSSKTSITEQSIHAEFSVLRKDFKLKIPCVMEIINGEYVLIVKTVIRNVKIINGVEVESKVSITKNDRNLLF